MSDEHPTTGERRLERAAVRKILDRASDLDRDHADSLTVTQFREAALEAGMSEAAVEEALAEHFSVDPDVEATVSLTHPRRQLAWDAGIGAIGGGLAALLALGPDRWITAGLTGIVLTAVGMLYRHITRNRLALLLRETLVFWSFFSVVWVLGTGDVFPTLTVLAPLGVVLTTLLGWLTGLALDDPAEVPAEVDGDRTMIPTSTPEDSG